MHGTDIANVYGHSAQSRDPPTAPVMLAAFEKINRGRENSKFRFKLSSLWFWRLFIQFYNMADIPLVALPLKPRTVASLVSGL